MIPPCSDHLISSLYRTSKAPKGGLGGREYFINSSVVKSPPKKSGNPLIEILFTDSNNLVLFSFMFALSEYNFLSISSVLSMICPALFALIQYPIPGSKPAEETYPLLNP